jgi:hypothetical protein
MILRYSGLTSIFATIARVLRLRYWNLFGDWRCDVREEDVEALKIYISGTAKIVVETAFAELISLITVNDFNKEGVLRAISTTMARLRSSIENDKTNLKEI